MEKNKNEELQSRRQFFKNAAGKAIPMLALTVVGGGLLSSCDKDDEPHNGCGSSCSGDCDSGCTNNCDSLCGGDCWAYCESKVKS